MISNEVKRQIGHHKIIIYVMYNDKKKVEIKTIEGRKQFFRNDAILICSISASRRAYICKFNKS